MIVTLTPNPSVDRAVTVDVLRRGEVLRAASSRIDPGGKGVNVTRALSSMGAESVAVVPSGGPEGALLEALLGDAGVDHHVVPIAGGVRMNTSVLEPDGTTTKLNEPGPALSAAEVEALLAAVVGRADGAGWIAGCGSLPPGAPVDLYATLVAEARARGAKVAIDSSGAPFVAAIRARPTLVKPNHHELAELAGRPLATLGEVVEFARILVARGIELVAVSLGRDGAVIVSADEVAHARSAVAAPVSTVGAGDCMLAGLLHGLSRGDRLADALAEGVRWGTAAVRLPGSGVPAPSDLHDLVVEVFTQLDADLRLEA